MALSADDTAFIPLPGEQIHVTKAKTVTDRVRVKTTVEEREVCVEHVRETAHLNVERIPVEKEVDTAPTRITRAIR